MFPNLRAEMARYNIKSIDLVPVLGISYDSVNNKMNGKTDFTRTEIFKIKKEFFSELSLEYLFEVENKTA